jgi:hypothetical protein
MYGGRQGSGYCQILSSCRHDVLFDKIYFTAAGSRVAVLTGSVEASGNAAYEEARAELKRPTIFLSVCSLYFRNGSCVAGCAHTRSGYCRRPKDWSSYHRQFQAPHVVLARMRLDAVGLMDGPTHWSHSNWIHLVLESSDDDVYAGDGNGTVFRYLPYQPLWFPQHLDPSSGKALVTLVMDEVLIDSDFSDNCASGNEYQSDSDDSG